MKTKTWQTSPWPIDRSSWEPLHLALASEIDTAQIQDREKDPLIAKVKLQKTLSLHLADHIMTLRMDSNRTAPTDVLSGATLDFLAALGAPVPLLGFSWATPGPSWPWWAALGGS